MPTVHIILANAAEQDWEIEHIDVKSAYLNALLKETVYMKAPHGVLKQGEEGKVLRLIKGLYGLKQAGRGWYLEMSKVFIENLGFERSKANHSVFYWKKGEEHTVVAVVRGHTLCPNLLGLSTCWLYFILLSWHSTVSHSLHSLIPLSKL